MNSMNAVLTVTPHNQHNTNTNNNQDGSYHRRSMRSLDTINRVDKIPLKRSRKRTSAIDSPTDLLVDSEKDCLLSTSHEDKKDCSCLLLEEDFVVRYQTTNAMLRYFYERRETFNNALELFNRNHCFLENNTWQSRGHFFECKGPIRVIQRMCTRCRDVDKPRTKTDLYYVDLGERNRERTILCHGCMGKILHQNVGTNGILIKKQLKKLRHRQQSGIYIYSRGNQ